MNLLPVFITVFSVLLLCHILSSKQMVITFERIQQLFGTDVADFRSLQLLGANGSVQSLNGTWALFQDLDNSWIYYERLYYQGRMGGFYPIQVPNRSFRVCDYLNSQSYRLWWTTNRPDSNYPEPLAGKQLCPFPKGQYRLFSVALGNEPPVGLAKPGIYKLEFGLARQGTVRAEGLVILRIEHVLYHRQKPCGTSE